MHIAALALAWLLLGQSVRRIAAGRPRPTAHTPAQPVAGGPAGRARPAEPVEADRVGRVGQDGFARRAVAGRARRGRRPHRPTPPADCGTLPHAAPRAARSLGNPCAGGRAVSVQDRRQQLESAHAYWRLAEAVARYGFCVEENKRLGRLPSGGDEALELRRPGLRRQQQSKRRRPAPSRQARNGRTDVALPWLAPPLPADRPHVGCITLFSTKCLAPGRGWIGPG